MEVVGSYRRGGVRADQVVQRTLPTDVQRLGATPTHGAGLMLGSHAEAATAADAANEAATDPLLIVASMGTEDRAGDVIDPDGWELSSYLRNPVFLWAHRRSDPPIGRSRKTWVEDDCLKALIEFAPTPEAQSVRTLYAGGYMRGISVGFRPLKWSQRAASNGRRGTHFTRQELLEISAAPVPMHPGTLARDANAIGIGQQDAVAIDAGARDAGRHVPVAPRSRSADISEVCSILSGLRRELEALY